MVRHPLISSLVPNNALDDINITMIIITITLGGTLADHQSDHSGRQRRFDCLLLLQVSHHNQLATWEITSFSTQPFPLIWPRSSTTHNVLDDFVFFNLNFHPMQFLILSLVIAIILATYYFLFILNKLFVCCWEQSLLLELLLIPLRNALKS